MGLELYYTAFLDLTTCRSMGYGEGAIPWLAINSYCRANGVRGSQREDMFYFVHGMDATYLNWRNKSLDKKD